MKAPRSVLLILGLTTLPLCSEIVPVPRNLSDWCLPENPGLLIDDANDRYIQQLRLGGYFHFHSAHVGGRAEGRDFSYARESEWRRARISATATTLPSIMVLLEPGIEI